MQPIRIYHVDAGGEATCGQPAKGSELVDAPLRANCPACLTILGLKPPIEMRNVEKMDTVGAALRDILRKIPEKDRARACLLAMADCK